MSATVVQPASDPVSRHLRCVAVMHDAAGRVLLHDGHLPNAVTGLSFAVYQGRGAEALFTPVVGAPVHLLRRAHYRFARNEVNERGEHVRVADIAFEFTLPAGARASGEWVRARQAIDRGWLSGWEREVLLAAGAPPTPRRPAWHRAGWRERTVEWLDAQLATLGADRAGEPELLRSWQISTLYRVPTSAGEVYLKGVPSFFERESGLTAWLARLDPRAAPPVLAGTADGTLFVTLGRGEPLGPQDDAGRMVNVMRHVGALQRETARRAEELGRLGCEDRSLDALEAHVTDMLADEAFLREGPFGLTHDELLAARALLPRLRGAIGTLRGLGLPSVLVHGDLNTGNVVFTGGVHTLIDWTDGALAHPLMDAATRGVLPEHATEEQHVAAREAWLDAWADLAPADQLREAVTLAAPLMELHRAVTYHRVIVPGIEDRSEWSSAAPEHLRAVLGMFAAADGTP